MTSTCDYSAVVLVLLVGCAHHRQVIITPLPRLVQVQPSSHVIAWNTEYGNIYWVEASTDLMTWTPVDQPEQSGDASGKLAWVRVIAVNPMEFYRVGAHAVQPSVEDINREITMPHRGP